MKLFHFFCVGYLRCEREGDTEKLNEQMYKEDEGIKVLLVSRARMPLEIDVIHIYVCCYTLRNGLILPVRIELLFEAGERLSFVYRRTRKICPFSRVELAHTHISTSGTSTTSSGSL